MAFSSFAFIIYFLPAFLLVYYLFPQRSRKIWLFLGSIGFYAYGTYHEPLSILLLLLSVIINFFAGLIMEAKRNSRKGVMLAAVITDLIFLFSFKYLGFILNSIFPGKSVSGPSSIVLPLGISFYTFSAISYVCDVYRGKIPACCSIMEFASYICMFPKLISGPIARFDELSPELKSPKTGLRNLNDGLRLFAFGLGIKVILADKIGVIWNEIGKIGYDSISTPLAWMGIIAFSIQLYLDFWGYSLMAMGLGEILGISVPENFRSPYVACTMTDFWRRWHITLGSWFRDYVYIPLGGSRNGKGRMLLSTAAVWLLTGIWHGAGLNYILWGALLCIIILFEKFVLRGFTEKYRLLGHIYMIILIPLSWLLFALERARDIPLYLARLIGKDVGGHIFAGDYLQFGKGIFVVFVLGLLFCTEIPSRLYKRFKGSAVFSFLAVGVFWFSLWCIYRGMSDPFMYFQF
ncbi:MAG: MBOAT family protein [Oscillospiraceae bacterium]|nr:MBOAT family protein [Oscillospiraceae bacterium]